MPTIMCGQVQRGLLIFRSAPLPALIVMNVKENRPCKVWRKITKSIAWTGTKCLESLTLNALGRMRTPWERREIRQTMSLRADHHSLVIFSGGTVGSKSHCSNLKAYNKVIVPLPHMLSYVHTRPRYQQCH